MTATTANSSLAPFISAAAVTFVNAIIEPTDRSMPPAMTTTVWAAAANATGSAARASESRPFGAVVGLDDAGQQQQHAQEHVQADDPGVAAQEADRGAA